MGDLARVCVAEQCAGCAGCSAACSSVAILELRLSGCVPLLICFGAALGSQFSFFPLAHVCCLQVWVCSTMVVPPLATGLPQLGAL